jgi:hypothetical protein
MIGLDHARRLAASELPEDRQFDDAGVRELRTGWYFPYGGSVTDWREMRLGGPIGIIVNKATGKRLVLCTGSIGRLEREFMGWCGAFRGA